MTQKVSVSTFSHAISTCIAADCLTVEQSYFELVHKVLIHCYSSHFIAVVSR